MKKKLSPTVFLAQAAMIAALYIVLTFIANALGLANYAIQVRFSEALTILPYFTPAAIPGLFAGCLLSNILTGCMPLDVIFGSLATLVGAFGTYALRKHKWHHFHLSLRTSLSYLWYYPMFISLKAACLISH